MNSKWLLFGCVALLASAFQQKPQQSQLTGGYVSTGEAAIKLVQADGVARIGKKAMKRHRPLLATLVNDSTWLVTTVRNVNVRGGGITAEIDRKKGRIRHITYGK